MSPSAMPASSPPCPQQTDTADASSPAQSTSSHTRDTAPARPSPTLHLRFRSPSINEHTVISYDDSGAPANKTFHPSHRYTASTRLRSKPYHPADPDPETNSRKNFRPCIAPPKTTVFTDEVFVMSKKIIATINSTGRQSASFIRVASAVGWHVRAQVRANEGLVAEELASLPNVELIEGDLTGPDLKPLLARLFNGARIAFINTTHWGDEVAIGKACADAAKKAHIAHYVYSSMPDHSVYGEDWRALPLWASKFAIENYVRQIGIPATFIYTGIYNNNFTSLPYPCFQMELQEDGSFVWQAPFHPDDPLPWLDAEHDVGPALLQIFKMGANHWKGQRVTMAFERLTPLQCCARFARGVGRPVRYVHGPIQIKVNIPSGYREQLDVMQETLGHKRAPYFGPTLEYPREARSIWEGHRGIEEYAREVFPIEEYANGLRWMEDGRTLPMGYGGADDGDGEMIPSVPGSRPITPGGMAMPLHFSGAYTPKSHPEGLGDNFFVGSI
ncbi:hypothetical protein Q7P35_004503 [Cladosporium inversicolor]